MSEKAESQENREFSVSQEFLKKKINPQNTCTQGAHSFLKDTYMCTATSEAILLFHISEMLMGSREEKIISNKENLSLRS